jgi:phage shock protein PspC (stress-responsive transcriptional regulator)
MVPVAGGSHDGDMTHNNHSRIVRPRSGRMIAGVAAALARQFGVDVTLVRLAFVVSLFFGGLGVLIYLAAWLLIPEEGQEHSAAERMVGS